MSALDSYYSAIRAEKAILDEQHPHGCLFMTSLQNVLRNSTAGSVAEMSTRMAAQQIVEATGRPSTKEEIEAFQERGRLYNAKIEAANERLSPSLGRVVLVSDSRGSKK